MYVSGLVVFVRYSGCGGDRLHSEQAENECFVGSAEQVDCQLILCFCFDLLWLFVIVSVALALVSTTSTRWDWSSGDSQLWFRWQLLCRNQRNRHRRLSKNANDTKPVHDYLPLRPVIVNDCRGMKWEAPVARRWPEQQRQASATSSEKGGCLKWSGKARPEMFCRSEATAWWGFECRQ